MGRLAMGDSSADMDELEVQRVLCVLISVGIDADGRSCPVIPFMLRSFIRGDSA